LQTELLSGISSRGVGETMRDESVGADVVDESFVLIAYDLVGEPSTHNAYLHESKKNLAETDVRKILSKNDRINRLVNELLRKMIRYSPNIKLLQERKRIQEGDFRDLIMALQGKGMGNDGAVARAKEILGLPDNYPTPPHQQTTTTHNPVTGQPWSSGPVKNNTVIPLSNKEVTALYGILSSEMHWYTDLEIMNLIDSWGGRLDLSNRDARDFASDFVLRC
jgi:hypothetical protein